jgi:hypothetical protein
MSPTQVLEQIQAWEKEDEQKLRLLCRSYEIATSPDMYKRLALELARKLYPEKKKRGRKSKWIEAIKGVLVVEVERLMSHGNINRSVEWACNTLAKREPWTSFLEIKESSDSSPDPAEVLRKIYFEFRETLWVTTARKASLYYEQEGDRAGWEDLLTNFVRKEF